MKTTKQLIGPFKANENLYTQIKSNIDNLLYISHIGIQMDNHTSPDPEQATLVLIDDFSVEIGKTGIYEIGNTEIKKKIAFTNDVDKDTIIDFIAVYEEID